jgi:hypothetical protein
MEIWVTIQPLRRKGTKEKIDMNSMKDNVHAFSQNVT